MKENILGYLVDSVSRNGLTKNIYEIISRPRHERGCSQWLACLNPHSYVVARNDYHFSLALKNADWLVADGIGVVLASKFLGGKIRDRITGYDVFCGLHERMNDNSGSSVFFLGSTDITLSKILLRMNEDYPQIHLAGAYSPPFKDSFSSSEKTEMIRVVNEARPDVLWVGMSAPKQEKWVMDNLNSLDVKFVGAVGAVFDFYSGNVRRSHPIFQLLGLEWLPRLIQQPSRLWPRMFISAPIFLAHLIRCKLFGKRKYHSS